MIFGDGVRLKHVGSVLNEGTYDPEHCRKVMSGRKVIS